MTVKWNLVMLRKKNELVIGKTIKFVIEELHNMSEKFVKKVKKSAF